MLRLWCLPFLLGISNSLENSSESYCICSLYNEQYTADCSSRNLIKIPDCVPKTTRHFSFAANNLQYQSKQFKRFKNLVSLNLSGNRWFDPRNDSFCGLSKLRTLYLNKTDFQGSPGVFSGLTHLNTLYLNDNYLRFTLPNDLFGELFNLESLDLSGNKLDAHDFQFAKLSGLLNLDLSKSEVSFQGKHSFVGLSKLKILSLSNSYWYTEDTPVDLFLFLESLEELNIEGFCIDKVTKCSKIDKFLTRVTSLKILHIHNIVLGHVLGSGFSSLQNLKTLCFTSSQVSFLHRRTCQIENLDGAVFKSLVNVPLFRLVIHGCHVGYFSGYIVSPVRKTLLSLDLVLSTPWCDGLYPQLAVGLRKSNIKNIRFSGECQFAGSVQEPLLIGLEETQVESLDLSNGPIEMISSMFVSHLPRTLSDLYLNGNKIKYIDTKLFHLLRRLMTLDLSNQHEMSEEYSVNTLIVHDGNKGCRPFPFSLISLNVSDSSLFCMMIDAFCGRNFSLKTLTAANLRNFNCLQTFWGTLKHLNQLQYLDLSGNNIREIPEDAFSGQRDLEKLCLARNYILELSFDIEHVRGLQFLDLRNNTIQYGTLPFIQFIGSVSSDSNLTIYLENNRLVCNCKRIVFVGFLLQTKALHQKDNLTCKFTNDTELSLSRISEIHDRLQNGCIAQLVTFGCIGVFILQHLILMIIALSCHNRWKLNYLLAVGRRTLNPYHPLEGASIEMEYDVYISYDRDYKLTLNEDLHAFVANKLYPGLRQRGFRVLIRDELDIGMRLYEVISTAVRKCDKVLVLLSKGYCSDHWNVFEFNMAALEGIYTKRQVVIPLAFENVDKTDLHEEVHAFLKEQSIPAYTKNSRITEMDFINYVSKLIRDNRPFD